MKKKLKIIIIYYINNKFNIFNVNFYLKNKIFI